MQVRSKLFFGALVSLAMTASSASAAMFVDFILDLSVPGAFTLSATVPGDSDANAGISFYSVPLLGNVTSLDHRSPFRVNQANFAPAGFNFLRSADSAGAIANPTILAGQDSPGGPIANLIYGFGQEASSFVAKGINPFPGSGDATSDEVWLNPLVIATGTYSGSLAIDTSSVDFVANVFAQVGQRETPAATARVGGAVDPGDDFEVNDLHLGGALAGANIVGGPLPTNATVADIAWSLVSFAGPGGAVAGASVDPNTGVFSWQSQASSPFGTYTATIQGINSGDPAGTDTGLLTFNLVPEPASVTLLGLAMVGALGFIRRR